MSRKAAPVVSEMLKAIEGIEEALAGKTFEDFSREWLLNHGIQRGIEIISEASRHPPLDLKKSRPEIRWTSIAGIGNVLRHDYYAFPMKSSGTLYVMICPLSGLRSNQFCLI
jgi:uncharacterized protein with HEPN domain